jgi:hypothetical protein
MSMFISMSMFMYMSRTGTSTCTCAGTFTVTCSCTCHKYIDVLDHVHVCLHTVRAHIRVNVHVLVFVSM